jgi:HEAT repeat protein
MLRRSEETLTMNNSCLARLLGRVLGAETGLLLTCLVGAVFAAPPATNPRQEIADALKSDRPVQRQAAATLLGDLSMDSPDVKEKGRFAEVRNLDEFVAELAVMADKDPDGQVREAAVTALGRMRPDLAKVLAPLSDVLLNKGRKRGVEERRSAADALASLVRRAVPFEYAKGTIEKVGENELVVKVDDELKLTYVVTPDTRITLDLKVVKLEDLNAVKPLEDRPNVRIVARRVNDKPVAVRIEAFTSEITVSASSEALENLIGRGQEIVPVAAIALSDPDAEVRRAGATVLLQIAAELTTQLKLKRPGEDIEILRPLYKAFREQSAALVKGVNDSDLTVRLVVRQALEELAAVYPPISGPVTPTPEKEELLEEQERQARSAALVGADDDPRDSLFSDLAPIVQALEKGISDTDVDARIAAIQALEMFGENALPATPTLVKALRDSDMFVRWSAARALGKIEASRRRAKVSRPAVAKGAVDGLIRLLSDTDLDVQLAGAVALEPFGADAGKAAGPLANAAATGDPSFRLAAIHALGEIGEPAHTKPVAAKISLAVAFPADPRVRAEAARLLGRFGPAAQGSIGALRAALKDSDPSVSRAAGEALLSIPAPNPK